MEKVTPHAENLNVAVHYDFELPRELIAQEPLPNREDSRLMVINRSSNKLDHHHFRDLDTLLRSGDCLVLNETRVIPAKLVGKRIRTGGRWQALVIDSDDRHWRMLAKTRGKIQPGESVMIEDRQGRFRFELSMLAKSDDGKWIGRPKVDPGETDDNELVGRSPNQLLDLVGRVPLPHYVRGGNMVDDDLQNYQTVFARHAGAVAAPTAGLHFTQSLLRRIIDRGIRIAPVTLHIGLGTFRPLAVENLDEHVMHAESGSIAQSSVDTINECRRQRGRIIAVGTTSMRVLETAARDGQLKAWQGDTDLFVKPGFTFQIIDGLLTNFHLPRSTLIVLVRTFGGDNLMQRAYEEAIAEQYRFFSYGDAMLII